MKINFVGQIFGMTGYDTHCKGLVNGLYKHTQDIHLLTPRQDDYPRWSNDAEMKMLDKNKYYQDGTTIVVGLPPFWRIHMSENPKHFIGFLVVLIIPGKLYDCFHNCYNFPLLLLLYSHI